MSTTIRRLISCGIVTISLALVEASPAFADNCGGLADCSAGVKIGLAAFAIALGLGLSLGLAAAAAAAAGDAIAAAAAEALGEAAAEALGEVAAEAFAEAAAEAAAEVGGEALAEAGAEAAVEAAAEVGGEALAEAGAEAAGEAGAEAATETATETEATANQTSDVLKDATPGKQSQPGMGSGQYSKPGGFDKANQDFDKIAGSNPVKDYGNGIRSAKLPDGTTVSVRPGSGQGSPTVQINSPSGNPIKVRYGP